MTVTSRRKPPKPWNIHFCIDGLSKPPRTAAHPRDYRRVKRYGAEFQKRRTVFE